MISEVFDGSFRRWAVRRIGGRAQETHDLLPEEPLSAEVWVVEVSRPALVLGSSQQKLAPLLRSELCQSNRDIDVAVRRSGGGAVYLAPGKQVWIEVFVAPNDRLFCQDVRRSVRWLGDALAEALGDCVGDVGIDVHTGDMDRSPLSKLICFAGSGPGEVSIGGQKVVGISQRRGRWGTRFQCVALLDWNPAVFAPLLRIATDAHCEGELRLHGAATGIACGLEPLSAAILESITRY